MADRRVRLHIKNNHASPDTFPPTPEGEEVFTITRERFDHYLQAFPDLVDKVDVTIDWDLDNFDACMRAAEILITWDLPTEKLRERAPELKWIHIIGAGVEHLCPMDWLPDDLVVTNNRGAHADKGGEFVLMAMLMLHNHLLPTIENQRRAHWESLYSTPVAGKTLVVVGTGHIGRGAAQRCRALGVDVIGVSRHGRPVDEVDRIVPASSLDEVLPLADFLLMATPMTEETQNLLDRRRQSLMKPGFGLINVGRAGTVDYDALVDNLRSGHCSGAILDVFDPEPLPADSPLWREPNLLVTPHISADDGDHYVQMTLQIFFSNLRRYLAAESLENAVNPQLGY